MPPFRVLVVDDSVVIRRLVSEFIDADPRVEIAATAANGRIALARLEQTPVDLVTLDIEMPEMDGLEALAEIRKRYPQLPVIMFSSHTERGAAATLDALSLGASDYVTKPSAAGRSGGREEGARQILEQLLPRILALCGAAGERDVTPDKRAQREPVASRWPSPSARPEILVIGVSTGGPNALMELIPAIPASFPLPILLVQHMPPMFTRMLAERLDRESPLCVREGVPGAAIRPGGVWVAPGDFHMSVRRRGDVSIELNQEPRVNSCRPAVDVLLRSAVEVYAEHTLALILTGMGCDGLQGCQYVRAAGGRVLAQDESTSVVWGMPGAVTEAGIADAVLPLGKIPGELEYLASPEAYGSPFKPQNE